MIPKYIPHQYKHKACEKRVFQRFMRFIINDNNKCWEWIGPKLPQGYGLFGFPSGMKRAHRISWMFFKGEIPKGLFVCHKCDNTSCVNPDHLFIGTQIDNWRDAINKGRNYKLPPFKWAEIMKIKKHHWQKLNKEDIPLIKERLIKGEGQRIIAEDYNVTTDTIGKIFRGERWAHI